MQSEDTTDMNMDYKNRWKKSPYSPRIRSPYCNEFVDAVFIHPKKQQCLIKDILYPGEITLIVGDPCIGKTTISASLVALVSNPNLQYPFGEDGYIKAESHGTVLWIALEDSKETTLVPRAIGANADLNNISFWQQNRSFKTTALEPELFRQIQTFRDIKLVVFDHIDLIYNEYPDTRRGRRQALIDVTQLARKRGFAILVNSHFTKSGVTTTNPLDRISGGNILGQTIRKIMFIEKIQGDESDFENREFALFDTKTSNSGVTNGMRYKIEGTTIQSRSETIETSRVKWLEPVTRQNIVDLLSRSRKPYETQTRIGLDEVIDFVRDFLAGGSRFVSELNAVAAKSGISKNLLNAARKELGVRSKKQEDAGQFSGWLCFLPERTCFTEAPTAPKTQGDSDKDD